VIILHIGTEKTGTTTIQEFFSANRSILNENNLVPSFTLAEVSSRRNELISVSQFGGKASKLSELSSYNSKGNLFVQLANPYCACYLMDLKLAKEYANSRAFTEKESRDLTWWDIGARAAMGVQFLDVPKNFTSRHVVQIEKKDEYCKISNSAVLHHLPNLYCQVEEIEKTLLAIDKIILNN
jgi:hypothetical protein